MSVAVNVLTREDQILFVCTRAQTRLDPAEWAVECHVCEQQAPEFEEIHVCDLCEEIIELSKRERHECKIDYFAELRLGS